MALLLIAPYAPFVIAGSLPALGLYGWVFLPAVAGAFGLMALAVEIAFKLLSSSRVRVARGQGGQLHRGSFITALAPDSEFSPRLKQALQEGTEQDAELEDALLAPAATSILSRVSCKAAVVRARLNVWRPTDTIGRSVFVAALILYFTAVRGIPVLGLSLLCQVSYNYFVLFMFTTFPYATVVEREFDARSVSCIISELEQETVIAGRSVWALLNPAV